MKAPVKSKGKRSAARPKKNVRDDALRRLLASDQAVGVGALIRTTGITAAEALVPPGSVLNAVVRALKQETDCPPELGIISTLAVLSAALCHSGSTYAYHDDLENEINPALWIVALAESGAGKTWVRDVVTKSIKIDLPTIPTPASGPAFLDSLAASGGIGYWDKDEYGQMIKQISLDSTLVLLKDLLLQAYGHRKLTNNTRTHGLVEVDKPVVCIYGSTPGETLDKCVTMEMLVDGFAARHLWAVTHCGKLDTFRYNERRVIELICEHPAITGLRETLKAKRQFVITEKAEEVFNARFRETVRVVDGSLRRGFIRRITWAAGHYALLYHLLTQKSPGEQIGVNAAKWAWRMVMFHLHSARFVMSVVEPGVTSKIERMTMWLDQQRAAGLPADIERRFFQRFSRDITSISEARQMLQICGLRK